MNEKEYKKMKEEMKGCMATLRQRGVEILAKKEYMAADEYANRACHLLWIVNSMVCTDGNTPEKTKEEFAEFLIEAMALKVLVEVSIRNAEEGEKKAASQTSQ